MIAADETLTSLADKVRKITGTQAAITTPRVGGKSTLQINVKTGHSIELIAGADGRDALAKIGMEPARLTASDIPDPKAPKVRPGGNFGLNLTGALNLGAAKDATVALTKIKSAISMTQTAYRSLYWDSTKEALVNGTVTSGGNAYQQTQLARYRDALDRLSGGF
ncbi:MAG: hypothetical protein ACREB5_01210 [Sphingomonadaceae bacterium]